MFGQATPTKSWTWSSSNLRILTGDQSLSDWTVYLGLSYTKNDLLTSFPTYASTICYGNFFLPTFESFYAIYALKLSFIKLNYNENIFFLSLLQEKIAKNEAKYLIWLTLEKNVIQNLEVNIVIIC